MKIRNASSMKEGFTILKFLNFSFSRLQDLDFQKKCNIHCNQSSFSFFSRIHFTVDVPSLFGNLTVDSETPLHIIKMSFFYLKLLKLKVLFAELKNLRRLFHLFSRVYANIS